MEEQAKYKVKYRPFHNEYYQGKSRKQYVCSGKLFLFALVGLVVLILLMKIF